MTYLQFHFVFTLPVIAVLLFLTWRDLATGKTLQGEMGRNSKFAFGAMLIHVLIALVYTTPWDNYLVANKVWGYGSGRVLFTMGYVPFEEYLFFILQTILTSLLLYFLARRFSLGLGDIKRRTAIRAIGTVMLFLLSAFGLVAFDTEQGTYLGLILIWAAPILAIQWAFGGDYLLERWRLTLAAVALPTFYLWIADRLAISLGIWWISEAQTTGLKLLGLPLEEALFFLVTNMLVVFGISLALHPQSWQRFSNMRRNLDSWWRGVLALWALSMIPTPLFPETFSIFANISTSLLALAVLGFIINKYGFSKALVLFVTSFVFGLAVEWLGSTTGFPFGSYSYTTSGLLLFGVPLLVPLGWWAFTMVAISISPSRWLVWFAPLVLVAWDLGLDPLMVSKGFWTFDAAGIYHNIPLTNFLGWYGAGFVLVVILLRLEPRLKSENSPDLQIIFVIQAFLMTFGLIFFGLAGAAAVSSIAMGLVALPLIWSKRSQVKRLETPLAKSMK